MLHVPCKGNGPAMPDVMSGRVEMIFEAYGSSRAHVKGGSVRALGITSTTRLPDLRDVPTFSEQGVPGYTAYTWMYLLAPAGTPPEAVERLTAALRSATSQKGREGAVWRGWRGDARYVDATSPGIIGVTCHRGIEADDGRRTGEAVDRKSVV